MPPSTAAMANQKVRSFKKILHMHRKRSAALRLTKNNIIRRTKNENIKQIARAIYQRQGEGRHIQCFAIAGPNRRCSEDVDSTLRKTKHQLCKTLKSVGFDFAEVYKTILDLVESFCCHAHKHVNLVQGYFHRKDFSRLVSTPAVKLIHEGDLERWLEKLCSRRVGTSELQSHSCLETSGDCITNSTKKSKIKPRIGRSDNNKLFNLLIEGGKPVQERGYVYIYCRPNDPHIVKIGWTTCPVKRLQAWRQKCGSEVKLLCPETTAFVAQVRRPQLLERLIHVELRRFNVKQHCNKCNKTHKEWFNVRAAHVKKVWQKFFDWLETEPYNSIEGSWYLRPDIKEEDLELLCNF